MGASVQRLSRRLGRRDSPNMSTSRHITSMDINESLVQEEHRNIMPRNAENVALEEYDIIEERREAISEAEPRSQEIYSIYRTLMSNESSSENPVTLPQSELSAAAQEESHTESRNGDGDHQQTRGFEATCCSPNRQLLLLDQQQKVPRLCDLVVELKSINWHKLGVQLQIPDDRLDKIDEDYQTADRKLYEVIKYWLLNEIDPSWDKICKVLQRIEGCRNVVWTIKKNYCSLGEFRKYACRHHRQLPACRVLGSSRNDTGAACTVSCELVSPQIEAAMCELESDFRQRVNVIRSSLTCTVDTIKELLQSELPAGEVKGQVGFLLTQSVNLHAIMESADIDRLFMTLSNINAWDFLHPQLLEYLVQQLGEDKAKKIMLEYKSKLIHFRSKTKMSEISGWIGNIPENPLFKKVVMMLGDGWKDKTYQQFEEMRVSLLRLQIFDKSQLGFCGALAGSILVALFTPKDIAKQEQKLQSMLEFFKDNDISAIYAEGVCLIRPRDRASSAPGPLHI